MLVRLTYVLVIIIWATTPLAIKLGGDTLSPLASLSMRILLAFVIGCAISTVLGWGGLRLRAHWTLYLAASISLFPNMALVYSAATYLPSGVISLMFALTPFSTLLLSGPILGEPVFQIRKILALVLAFAGLAWLLLGDVGLPRGSRPGLLLMLVSNLVFSLSAVWVKKLNATLSVSPVEQTLGAMAFSLPGLLLCWYLMTGFELPVFSPVSLASLLYLAICGSLLGFVAYYFILRQLTVDSVALIPLLTPVLAMALGNAVAGEVVSLKMLCGAALILLALAVYQGLLPWNRSLR